MRSITNIKIVVELIYKNVIMLLLLNRVQIQNADYKKN